MKFSKRLDLFGDEIFAALNNRRMELEAQGMKIYNMSVGTPDFKTPEYIKKAVAEAAMDDNNWKYSLRDLPELLEAVCEYYRSQYWFHLKYWFLPRKESWAVYLVRFQLRHQKSEVQYPHPPSIR